MEITDREVYEWLLLSNRYARTRNNHLEPAATFDKTIEVCNRWENKQKRNSTISQILSELAFESPFISETISTATYTVGIRDGLRKTYCDYALNLSQIADPDKNNPQLQQDVNKIVEIMSNKKLAKIGR